MSLGLKYVIKLKIGIQNGSETLDGGWKGARGRPARPGGDRMDLEAPRRKCETRRIHSARITGRLSGALVAGAAHFNELHLGLGHERHAVALREHEGDG